MQAGSVMSPHRSIIIALPRAVCKRDNGFVFRYNEPIRRAGIRGVLLSRERGGLIGGCFS